MRVLHIAGGFAQHPLYVQLVQHLRMLGYCQTVFAPVRSALESSRQPPDEPGVLEYHFRHMLKPVHRVLFRTKIRSIHRELCASVDPMQFGTVHAHTLYSDGAVALRLRNNTNVPYVVAVRNTDLNYFMRLRPDLRWLAQDVLNAASRVVFISPAYRDRTMARLGRTMRADISKKSVVVPNGLSSYWLEQFSKPTRASSAPLRLLFVGSFTRNKNVHNVLRAAAMLSNRMPVQLTLVGSGGGGENLVQKAIDGGEYPFATYRGRVDNRQSLRSIYRDHDIFLMPSFRETFGVVYIEALSQGLPVIHSRGEGVDGFFPSGTVSESVDPGSVHSIALAIEKLAERIDDVRPVCIHEAQKFGWVSVVRRYGEIYSEAASN